MSSEHKRKISDLLQVNADLQTKFEDKWLEIQHLWRPISLAHTQKLRANSKFAGKDSSSPAYRIK